MSVNVNNNVYFALNLAKDGYASIQPVEGFSLCGGQDFTLSVQFYAKQAANKKIELVRQEGTFALGIDNRAAYFQSEGFGKIILAENSYLISEDVWNTITVTYDRQKLRIYVNGIKCIEESASAEGQYAADEYEIGRHLEGHIKYVKMFDSCLSDAAVTGELFEEKIPLEEAELFLDFSLPVPQDKGKYGKTIHLNNESIEKQVLQVQNNGKVTPVNSEELKIIFLLRSFTVVFNIYPMGDIEHPNMLLFSTGQVNDSGKFNIVGSKINGNFAVSIEFAQETANVLDIPIGEWSQIAITYNRSGEEKMTVYLNGKKKLCKTWGRPATEARGDVLIASARDESDETAPFDGYMEYFNIFTLALDEQTIQSYYQNIYASMSDSQLLSMYACINYKFIDIKKQAEAGMFGDAYVTRKVFNENMCNPTSFVYALDAGQIGRAVVPDSEELCRLICENSFSFYSKVYVNEQYTSSAVFSCVQVDRDAEKGLEIYLNRDENGLSFTSRINGVSYINTTQYAPIADGPAWADIVVTYSKEEQKLRLFVINDNRNMTKVDLVRDILFDSFTAEAAIGNSTVENKPFNGYIDYFAVFNGVLPDSEYEKYSANPPYIFEPNIEFLYCFHEQEALEQVKRLPISLAGDASVAIRLETQQEQGEQIDLYVPELEHSETQQWRANIAAGAYTELCFGLIGIHINILINDPAGGKKIASKKFVTFYEKYLDGAPEVEALVNSYEKINEKIFKDFAEFCFNSPISAELALAFGACAGNMGTALAACAMSEDLIVAAAVVGTVAGVLLAVFAVVKIIVSERDPIPDDPECNITIDMVEFPADNSGTRAVQIRGNIGSENVLFIGETVSGEQACVRVTYTYTGSVPYEIKLKGLSMGANVLGDTEEKVMFVAACGTYTLEFKLLENKIRAAAFGEFSNPINWIENGKLIKTTNHAVHILAGIPALPWNIALEESSPTLSALKTCAKIAAYSIEKVGTLECVAGAAAKWLHNSERFTYSENGEAKFSGVSGRQLIFSREAFDIRANETGTEKIQVNPLDCSLIIADTAKLNGFRLADVAELTTGFTVPVSKADPTQNPVPVIQTGETKIPLEVLELYKIGASEARKPENVLNHFIMLTNAEKITEQYAFDGYFKSKDKELFVNKRFADMETAFVFSDDQTLYRESVFEKYYCCIVEQEYSSWTHGAAETEANAAENVSKTSAFNMDIDQLSIATQKEEFDKELLKEFGELVIQKSGETGVNLCHSISKKMINNAILAPVSATEKGEITVEQCHEYLDSLKLALYAGRQVEFGYDENIRDSITAIINEIPNQNNESLNVHISTLFGCMSNCHNNLRNGDSSWNKSTQESFDPEEWCYVDNNLNVTSCYENILDYKAVPYNQYHGFSNKINIKGEGFYLTNLYDGIRCHYMKNTMGFDGDAFYIITGKTENNERSYKKYIPSSSNITPFDEVKYENFYAKVYFYYDNDWIIL